MAAYCERCGAALGAAVKFCGRCGTPIITTSELARKAAGEPADTTAFVQSTAPAQSSARGHPIPPAYHPAFAQPAGFAPTAPPTYRAPVATPVPWYAQTPIVILALILFFPLGVILTWGTTWSLRAKRAITGAAFYPAGMYFLWNYTRLSRQAKGWLLAVAAGLSLILLARPQSAGTIWLLLGAGFLLLFLQYDNSEPAARDSRQSPPASAPDNSQALRLLAIEEARTVPERRLLIASAFMRLAERALTANAAERSSWPSPAEAAALRRETSLLLASATDASLSFLPDPDFDDPLSSQSLIAAVRALDGYVALLQRAIAQPWVSLEELRVLARERTHVRAACDAITGLVWEGA